MPLIKNEIVDQGITTSFDPKTSQLTIVVDMKEPQSEWPFSGTGETRLVAKGRKKIGGTPVQLNMQVFIKKDEYDRLSKGAGTFLGAINFGTEDAT